LVAVAAGGALGAIARYAVSRGLPTGSTGFPWSTFLVNVTGSAGLGILLTVIVERVPRGRLARPLLGTGVIGAYTTFSTFTVDAALLAHNGRTGTAAAYVAASFTAGLAAAVLAVAVARGTVRGRRSKGRSTQREAGLESPWERASPPASGPATESAP
jgi:CrcB protein